MTAATKDTDCLFCRIVAGEIPATVVAQSERTFAFRDIAPLAPVHVLVVPKDHYQEAATLPVAVPGMLDEMIATAVQVATEEGIAESGYRLVLNTGPDAGRTVFHAHLHVLGGERLGGFGSA